MTITNSSPLKVLLLKPYLDNIKNTCQKNGDNVDVVNTKLDAEFM